MSKRSEFLSIRVHPNIAAAALVAIAAGVVTFVMDTKAQIRDLTAGQQLLQHQVADLRRTLDRVYADQPTSPGR